MFTARSPPFVFYIQKQVLLYVHCNNSCDSSQFIYLKIYNFQLIINKKSLQFPETFLALKFFHKVCVVAREP